MTSQNSEYRSECQNATALEGGVELNAVDVGRVWVLRILRSAQRRLSNYFGSISRRRSTEKIPAGNYETSAAGTDDRSSQSFEVGDIVEVLGYEEIKKTLDERGFCEGLEFMEGMQRLCGQRLPITKIVRRIYDERARRMIKMKKARYILDGAICDGRGMYDREGCDRCCFYFWSPYWLRRSR